MAIHSSVLAWRIPGMGGAWWAAVYGVAQSRTRLKRLSSSRSSALTSHQVKETCMLLLLLLLLLQSCPTLCDPIDGSPPGSPVPGILQARTLEWGAIAFSNA